MHHNLQVWSGFHFLKALQKSDDTGFVEADLAKVEVTPNIRHSDEKNSNKGELV